MRKTMLYPTVAIAFTVLVWAQPLSADNAANQENMDAFYSTGNVINLTVTMNSEEWYSLRTQEPEGGECNNDYIGDRYTWFEAQNLEIEVAGLDGNVVVEYDYPDIGIKKKSYCGSIDSDKPSLNLDLSKYDDANEDKAESEIGTTRLTWNNSLQDPSILKQCFGYHLFRLAGLPSSRCNLAWLSVYMPDTGDTEEVGIYVNVEPIKKKYLKNPANAFTAGDDGNLYEISTHDIDLDGVTYNEYKGYSDEYVRQDYAWSATQMDQYLLGGIEASVDVAEYIQYWAMEAITQHRDGYSRNITNAYIYNDDDLVDATSLSESNIAFSFLPWGIDKIMDSTDCWQIYCCARVAQGLFENSTYLQQVNQAISDILADFEAQQEQIDQYIDALAAEANATWTGTDVLFGENGSTIDDSAAYLHKWLAAAVADAVASIDGGANNSCFSDCFNGPPSGPCNKS